MDIELLAIAMTAFFLAAFGKGITGMGFSTSALPLLVLTIGLERALPILIIPSVSSNLIVMVEAGHFREMGKRFWPLYLMAIPGVVVGLYLLSAFDGLVAGAVLGAVLILYSGYVLRNPHLTLPARFERPLAPVVGFLNGTINGLTGSQVMPVLPYLLALKLDPNRFVQAINITFTLSSLVMFAGLAQIGFMSVETALLSIIGLVPVWVGIKLGNRFRRRLSPESFRRIILILLLIFGVMLIGKLWL